MMFLINGWGPLYGRGVGKIYGGVGTMEDTIIIAWKKLQPFKKYLRQTLVFMRNSALREKFNFYFSRSFRLV